MQESLDQPTIGIITIHYSAIFRLIRLEPSIDLYSCHGYFFECTAEHMDSYDFIWGCG